MKKRSARTSRRSESFWSRRLVIDRKGMRTSRTSRTARASRISRTSRSSRRSNNSGAHLAILAVSAVIVFQVIGIASNFSLNTDFSAATTGFAVAKTETPDFSVVRSYAKQTEGCDNFLDANNPNSKGYSVYVENGEETTAYDSCVDGDYALEYYCDASNNLNAAIGKCPSGCFSQGEYGYCA